MLNSGTVAGPVTITASVTATAGTVSASSAVVSIGGGVSSATHFDLAVARKNLPGLVKDGFETTFTAFLADRFGNYNVLSGTSVSFYTEAGAIDASNTVDSTGKTTAIFRTQAPIPANVTETASETAVRAALNATYTGDPTIVIPAGVHPRDGWVTVLATVQGEEAFVDANGDGLYNAADGDTFTDLGEPFIDQNDNGTWDSGEIYIDTDGNGSYTGLNGVWDGPGCSGACQTSKTIWTQHTIMFTGNATYCELSTATILVANGGNQTIRFMVGDENTNMLVPGTTVVGALTGAGSLAQTTYIIPDGVGGPYQASFTILDSDSADTDPPASAVLSVTVTPPAGEVATCATSIATGTVD